MIEESKMNRIRGVFYGQLIGDALGSRYEFKLPHTVSEMIENDKNNKEFLPILGGGPFNMKPGQVTDDSEMALALTESLIENKSYIQSDVVSKYVEWHSSSPPDIGITTANALKGNQNLLNKNKNDEILMNVLNSVEKCNSTSLSNGSLMRQSPLAIAFHHNEDELLKSADLDTKLTHCNQTAIHASQIYLLAISALINGDNFKDVYQKMLNHEISKNDEIIYNLLKDAHEKPIPVRLSDGTITDGSSSKIGYLGVAFQSAFYELLYSESFSQGLENIIKRGGDTDTNGCIGATLLGGKFGINNIPNEWIDTVKSSKSRNEAISFLNLENLDEKIQSLADISMQ